MEFSLSPAVWPWSASGHSLVVHQPKSTTRVCIDFITQRVEKPGRLGKMRKIINGSGKMGCSDGWMNWRWWWVASLFIFLYIYIVYFRSEARTRRPKAKPTLCVWSIKKPSVSSSPSINSTTNRAGGELQSEKSTFVIIQNYYYYYLEKGEP